MVMFLLLLEEADQGRLCEPVPGCTDGSWGAWHEWGKCICTGNFLQYRVKTCDYRTGGGLPCEGEEPKESRACATNECDDLPGPQITVPAGVTTVQRVTQPRSTVPDIESDTSPSTKFRTVEDTTTLPPNLIPESSTNVDVVGSVSSTIGIVAGVCLLINHALLQK